MFPIFTEKLHMELKRLGWTMEEVLELTCLTFETWQNYVLGYKVFSLTALTVFCRQTGANFELLSEARGKSCPTLLQVSAYIH